MSAGTPQETLPGTREFLREYVARLKLNGRPVHAQEIEKVLTENDRLEQCLEKKPNQPILNAARQLVLATDNAERNAALGDLYNALALREAR